MNVWLTLLVGDLDHPHVERDDSIEDDGVPVDGITIKLSDTVSLIGDAANVRRWVEELNFKVVTL